MIRRAFVAPPGRLLMSVDFNQLGLHVLAHLTKDPALVEPLRARADMHLLTASAVLEKPADEITLEERQLGKVVNFATFAGQGASALALQLGVTAAEAKEYIARFDRHYARSARSRTSSSASRSERGYIDDDRRAALADRRPRVARLARSLATPSASRAARPTKARSPTSRAARCSKPIARSRREGLGTRAARPDPRRGPVRGARDRARRRRARLRATRCATRSSSRCRSSSASRPAATGPTSSPSRSTNY